MKKLILILLLVTVTACSKGEESTHNMDDTKSKLKRITQNIKSKGDLQTAAMLESKIILLDESDPSSYITLAKSLRQMKNHDEAMQVLLDGEKIDPSNSLIQLEIAKTLIESDRPQTALDRLNKIQSLNDKDFYNAKGVAYDMIGEYENAQKEYRKGLEIAQGDGLLLNNLALSYLLNREYENGVVILEDLVRRVDAKEKYRHNLALAYGLSGQSKKAYNMLAKDISEKQAKENLEYYKDFR